MKNLFLVCLLVFVGLNVTLNAQGFGTIFRAGLNVSSFGGDRLTTADGRNIETYNTSTGFHIGAGARYKFDYEGKYGASLELLYSLKGGLITFEGDSYYIFRNSQGAVIRSFGTRRQVVDVSNSYIEFPVNFFAKVGKLEFHAGAYAGFRLRSIANGEYRFTSSTPSNVNFSVILDQNFTRDKLPDYSVPFPTDQVQTLQVAGEFFQIPRTQGAYFEHEVINGPLYRSIDIGLLGGISYYLTDGLFLGLRAQYGLSDVTRNDMHINLNRLNENNQLLFRDEVQRNLILQISVGFAF